MKEYINNVGDDILVKYMLGEATATEHVEVEEWVAASSNNKKYFDHFRLIWEESKHLASTSAVNENEAWERFVRRTERDEEVPVTQGRVIPLRRFAWVRVAALLVVLVGAGWLIYTMAIGGNEQMMASSGSGVLIKTLPDGSVVTLNRNSSLSYPAAFEGDTRTVTLKGEAFFNVTPNKRKPFIINADNASIKVVGTSFNVKSTSLQTEVIVETGIVEVAKKQSMVRLLPQQKAIVTASSEVPMMEQNTDELYNYYRTGEFVCRGTTLRKVVAILNDAYDAQIVIADKRNESLPLNATFHKDEPLDGILNVISSTFKLTVERKGEEIILK